jgi:hypothetical protein
MSIYPMLRQRYSHVMFRKCVKTVQLGILFPYRIYEYNAFRDQPEGYSRNVLNARSVDPTVIFPNKN